MKKFIFFLIGVFCFSCDTTNDDDENTAQALAQHTDIEIYLKTNTGENMLDPEYENAFSLNDILIERKDGNNTDYVIDNSSQSSLKLSLYANSARSQSFFRITLPNGDVHIIEAYLDRTSDYGYRLIYIKELKHNAETVFTANATYYTEGGLQPSLTLIVQQ